MNDIVNVIESYGIELKKQGQLYIGLCPFHDDKNTPNLIVYESTQSFCCYACKKAGNVIKFISLIEGKEYDEAKKRYIAQDTQHNLKLFGSGDNNKINFKNEVMLLAADVCRNFLRKNSDKAEYALDILKKWDDKLMTLPNLDYETGMGLYEKFKKYINSIGGAA
jgi:DNA primase